MATAQLSWRHDFQIFRASLESAMDQQRQP
jgi:hypothetical protein